jgi:hypothetical protein
MSDNEHTGIVFASLTLRGKDLVPQAITDAIGIHPTKSFKQGDVRKGTKKWPHGYWELTTKETVQSADLSIHLEWLVGQLEPSKTKLTEIIGQDGIDAEISCFWILPSSHESLSLSAELLIKIASLGIQLDLDFYCPD